MSHDEVTRDQIRTEVLEECAKELEARQDSWMEMYYALNGNEVESAESAMAFYNAMECGHCADDIRMLHSEYREKVRARQAKIQPWVKALMKGENPGPLPTLEEH